MRLDISTTDGIQVIALRLDPTDTIADLGVLKRAIEAEAKLDRPSVIDLSALDFLNSSAIGSLVGATRLFNEKGGSLVLVGLGTRLAETFRVVRLDRVVAYRATLEDAVRDLKVTPSGAYHKLVRQNPTFDEVKEAFRKRMRELGDNRPVPGIPGPLTLNRVAAQVYGNQHAPTEPTLDEGEGGVGPDGGYTDPPTVEQAYAESPGLRRESLVDWTEALLLFSKAQMLSQRHAMRFDPHMSFSEFLSEMAERLADEGEAGDPGPGAPPPRELL
jgi:anti-anti-sigma factor